MDDDLQQEKEMAEKVKELVSQASFFGPAGYLVIDTVYMVAFFDNDMPLLEKELNKEAERLGITWTFMVGEYYLGGAMISWSSR